MKALDARTLRELRSIVGKRGLLTAPEDLQSYECDGLTNFRALPRAVLLPASTQEVQAIGQRLAADVLWPEQATIGGILSANDSGALRLRYGGLRDLIIGVTLALADGKLAASGGKVVKNVAGYDLPKLAAGALGTLGVTTR